MINFSAAAKVVRAYFNRNTPEPDFAFCAGALINANGTVGAKLDTNGNLLFTGDQLASATDALTAHAGGGQGSATALPSQVNRFTTVATAADSAVLPAATAGKEITVINDTANSMNVYPATGEAINALSANSAFAVGARRTVTFTSAVAALWNTNGVSTSTGTGLSVFQTTPALILPTIDDSADVTKVLAFQLSGATTGKTLTLASAHTNNRTVTFPDATDTLVGQATTDTLTNKTLTGNINADTKFCTTQFDAVTGTTGATLTNVVGLTGFNLVAGATYAFEIELSGISTTNCGIKIGFKYTTATLTSLESKAIAQAAASMALVHSTTATDAATLIGTNAAAWLGVRLTGRIVVNAAGTLAVQAAQNAAHADTTSVYVGSWAKFIRVA